MKQKLQVTELIDKYIIDNFYLFDTQENFSSQEAPSRLDHGLILILVFSGKAVMNINKIQCDVKANMLIAIAPFQSYIFLDRTEDFRYQIIAFKLEFMSDFPLLLRPSVVEKIDVQPCVHLSKAKIKLIKEYFKNIFWQYEQFEHPSRVNIIKASLFILIAEISYIYSEQATTVRTTHKEQIVDDFFRLLHTFYRKERKPEFYATHLNLSTKYLTKVLQDVTKQTLYVWICDFVVREAKIMLRSSDLSVSQIADELNFPSSSYFARYFRKYVGVSPVAFREEK